MRVIPSYSILRNFEFATSHVTALSNQMRASRVANLAMFRDVQLGHMAKPPEPVFSSASNRLKTGFNYGLEFEYFL